MPSQIWKCNQCGAVHATEAGANACELGHPAVKPNNFEMVYREGEKLPYKLVLTWNKKTADYVRRRRNEPSEPDYVKPRFDQHGQDTAQTEAKA